MKVKDLIVALQALDPELHVGIRVADSNLSPTRMMLRQVEAVTIKKAFLRTGFAKYVDVAALALSWRYDSEAMGHPVSPEEE